MINNFIYADPAKLPISFRYDGVKMCGIPESFNPTLTSTEKDGVKKTVYCGTNADGLEELKEQTINYFVKADKTFECLFPYSEGGLLSYLHKYGKVDMEEYTETGISVKGKIPPEHFGKIEEYLVEN